MSEHNDMAEALQLELYRAAKIVKLAAFASEARRVLRGIESTLEFHPKVRELLRSNVKCMSAWKAHEDVTAEVLDIAADRIAEASDGLLDLAFKRAKADSEVQA